MPLAEMLSDYWHTIQGHLFPWLEEELGPLSQRHQQFVTVPETARLEVDPTGPGAALGGSGVDDLGVQILAPGEGLEDVPWPGEQ